MKSRTILLYSSINIGTVGYFLLTRGSGLRGLALAATMALSLLIGNAIIWLGLPRRREGLGAGAPPGSPFSGEEEAKAKRVLWLGLTVAIIGAARTIQGLWDWLNGTGPLGPAAVFTGGTMFIAGAIVIAFRRGRSAPL